MQITLLDDLHDRFIEEDTTDDAATQLRRFVDFCNTRLAAKRITGVRYNNVGQACLMFEDGSAGVLGNPVHNEGGVQGSYAFTQQPRPLDAPITIEARSVSFTKPKE